MTTNLNHYNLLKIDNICLWHQPFNWVLNVFWSSEIRIHFNSIASFVLNVFPKVKLMLLQVSESTKQVGRFSVSDPSHMAYKDMASHCEALQIEKQQVMSNFMSSQLMQENPASFSCQDDAQALNNPFYKSEFFMVSYIWKVDYLPNYTFLLSEFVMLRK